VLSSKAFINASFPVNRQNSLTPSLRISCHENEWFQDPSMEMLQTSGYD